MARPSRQRHRLVVRRWHPLAAIVSAAMLAVLPAPAPAAALTVAVDGSGTGNIPDSPGAGGFDCGVAGAPRVITFDVSGVSGTLTDVELTISGTHPYIGDMGVTLIAPDSTAHVIFSRLLAAVATGNEAAACGDGSDFGGPYTFTDQASASLAVAANAVLNMPVPPGSYRTATAGGVPGGSQNSLMTPVFAGVADLNGTWTLQVVDWGQFDTGSISAASLTLSTAIALSSQASPLSAVVGDELLDVATLSGSEAATGNLEFAVYGPDNPTCAEPPVFLGGPHVEVAGDGDYTSDPFTAEHPGVYRWVVSYVGDANNDPASTPCGDPAQTVTVTAAAPGLALAKTAGGIADVDGNGADPGDTITYTFTVTNTGNVTLIDVSLDDPLVGGAVACGTAPLAPGQARRCDPAVYTLADGDRDSTLVNTATATATAEAAGAVQASAAVSTPIPPACVTPPTDDAPASTEEPVETSEAPLSEASPDTTEQPTELTEQPTDTTEQPASTEAAAPTSEQPTDTTEDTAPTSEATTEPTIASDDTVTVAASTAPLGFAAAHPRQLDPCALPPTTTTRDPTTTVPMAPAAPAITASPTTPSPSGSTGSGGGGGGPAGSLPVTGTSPIATLLIAVGLVIAGLAVAGVGRGRHGIEHSEPGTRT
jgi:uncharacterized repeat protein (TIGR01451 family)